MDHSEQFSNPMERTKRHCRSWNEEENDKVLDYLLETIREGGGIAKPCANGYYQRAVERLDIPDCTSSQLKHQSYNLKRKYRKAVEWRNNARQDIFSEEDEESLRDAVLKKCPLFDKLDALYGAEVSSSCTPFMADTNFDRLQLDEKNPADFSEPEKIEVSFVLIDSEDEDGTNNPPNLEDIPKRRGIKRRSKEDITSLVTVAKMKLEIQRTELQFKKEMWEKEKHHKSRLLDLERQKFEIEKLIQEQQLQMNEFKVKHELEFAKMKLEKGIKLHREIMKLPNYTENAQLNDFCLNCLLH